ncbi:hypothetical protein Dda_3852 [Drechslerella dactyloides]|uniref:Uncharacterized protein n=1 Tax=Drechslerella dactyloides TaxID=74499 RepID=A0AAD6J074_DREDA|nr:hypothetical protein Dda_3852 [Drechslerella dactyloides]
MVYPEVGIGLLPPVFEGGLLWVHGRMMVLQGGNVDTQFPHYLDDVFWVVYIALVNRFLTAYLEDIRVNNERRSRPLPSPEDIIKRMNDKEPVQWAWVLVKVLLVVSWVILGVQTYVIWQDFKRISENWGGKDWIWNMLWIYLGP